MNTQDCVILGWTPGKGGRAGLVRRPARGGDRRRRAALGRSGRFGLHRTHARGPHGAARAAGSRPDPPIDDPELAAVKGATFVRAELVCEVRYLEMTKSTRKMRAPRSGACAPTCPPRTACWSPRPAPSGRRAHEATRRWHPRSASRRAAGRARAWRSRRRCPRPRAARRSRCSPRPTPPTAVATAAAVTSSGISAIT